MKIVVTGALGHIGSRLIRKLPVIAPNLEIVLIDDLSTQRYSSLFNLPAEGHYTFIEADVLTAELGDLLRGAAVVVHLAAITDATSSFGNRVRVEEVNFAGTQRVARACLDADCRLIFPSTTSVYGSQASEVDESCCELKPQSPYAESKLRAEQLLQSMHEQEGLRFVTCRFGTIFGTSIGMRFHTAINKFCWQAVMGQPLTVWETALHQYRPYLDLGDAVAALIFLIQHERYDGRVYNVLTTNATVHDIVQIIATHVPDTQVEYVQSEIMNQLSYYVSDRRFRALGFDYQGNLASGIEQIIDLLGAACQKRYVPRLKRSEAATQLLSHFEPMPTLAGLPMGR